MTRQQRFRPAELTGDRRTLYDAIASGPRSAGPQRFPLTDDEGPRSWPSAREACRR